MASTLASLPGSFMAAGRHMGLGYLGIVTRMRTRYRRFSQTLFNQFPKILTNGLPAEIGDELALLVADLDRAIGALECGLGVLVAERCGALVVALGGGRVLRAPAPALRELAHPLERAGMILL